MVGAIAPRRRPDPSFLDRLARVADRLRAARAGWRSSTTTSRRRSTSSACTRISSSCAFEGRRELTAYIAALRAGARRFRIQPPGARGARASAAPASCRSSPTSRISICAPDTMPSRSEFDDGWTNIMFVGRVIPNKKFEDVIRASTPTARVTTRGRDCCWSALMAGSRSTWRCCTRSSARLGTPTCTSSGTSRTRSSRRSTTSRISSCARASTKASACRSSRAFYKRVPVLAYAATRGAGDDGRRRRALRHEGSVRGRARSWPRSSTTPTRGRGSSIAGRRARAAAGTGLRRHAAPLRRSGAGRPPRPAPEVPWDFWAAVRAGETARGAAPVPAGDLSGFRAPSRTGLGRGPR